MSQPTKITLRDNDRNILQLNRKNMPDNIVYSQQLSGYASNTELADYAKIQTLSNYVQTSELSGYAKKEDIAEKPLQTITQRYLDYFRFYGI